MQFEVDESVKAAMKAMSDLKSVVKDRLELGLDPEQKVCKMQAQLKRSARCVPNRALRTLFGVLRAEQHF